MKKRKTIFNNNKATSPVIGVMLMIVVTVILAAAVSSYSSGMFGGTKMAPSAVFEVQIKKNVEVDGDTISFLKIKEVTGDTIDTSDLKIVTYYPKGNATPMTEVIPGQLNANSTDSGNPGVAPYWNNPAIGEFGDDAVNFGNYTLKPGVVMMAKCEESSVDDSGLQAVIAEWENVSEGDFITVGIVHTHSGKVIFESDVEVI